jgi:mannose-1-phosphate guanylyltransferase
MKAMVLAAGVGSRLEPLTAQLPKPLVPVANVPVMEHILNLLRQHQFDQVCANLHYLPEKLTDYFGTGEKFGVKLHFKFEEKLSGDAGGVRACRQFLQDGTFIVIMGDLLTDADLTQIVRQHKEKKALASIAIKAMDDVSRFGVVVTDKNGFITGFQEKPKAEEALSNFISTGIYVFEPEVFDHIPASGDFGFGRQLFPQLVAKNLPVQGIKIEGYWSDVGTIKQYRESNFDALSDALHVKVPGRLEKRNGHNVWIGEGARLSDDAVVEGPLQIGRHTIIGAGTKFSGTVILGDDVVVKPGAQLTDTIVWKGSTISTGAHLTDSVIGMNCFVDDHTKHCEIAAVESPPPPVVA